MNDSDGPSHFFRHGGSFQVVVSWIAWGLIGGVVGYTVSWVALALLGVFFWGPYWQQLNAMGFAFHDVSYTYVFLILPPIFALAFLITTLTSILTLHRSRSSHRKAMFIGVNMLPGLIAIAGSREYPGFEIAMLSFGFGWGAFLHRAAMRRQTKLHLAQGQ